jgi:lipopolysaccharide export system permease protein
VAPAARVGTMTIYRYFAIRFLRSFLATLAAFMVLSVMIETVEQLRRFASDSMSFSTGFGLSLLAVPRNLYDILPLVALLATIVLYLSLARTSELTVARAAGLSALRVTTAPVLVSMLIGIVAVAAVNPIIAATGERYERITQRLDGGVISTLSVGGEGLWLRQPSLAGQTVIHAARVDPGGTRFDDVAFFGFDEFGRALYRIEAESARLGDGAWEIGPGKRWLFTGRGNPEANARDFDSFALPSDLTQRKIRDSVGEPADVPIWDLPDFIRQLEAAGFSATAHRLHFQSELAKPFLMAAMILAGAAFLLRPARFGRLGVMVLAAVLAGAALFFLRNFANVMAEAGSIPVVAAAWAPPTAGLLIGLWLMLQFEDA